MIELHGTTRLKFIVTGKFKTFVSCCFCFVLFCFLFFFFQFITVPVRPTFALASIVSVGHKQTAVVIREVEGNSTHVISWSPCYGKYVVYDKQYLNISRVQTACANYTCTATNALGVDSGTTVLCKWTVLHTCSFVARKFAP